MDKSYVTLEKCPICGGDTGTIILDRRLKPRFEMHTTNPGNVCGNCRSKYLSRGVMLINPHTCRLVVIKDEVYLRLINVPMPKGKICFTDDEVLDKFTNLSN